jgi:hypothetical protein
MSLDALRFTVRLDVELDPHAIESAAATERR